MCYVSFYKDHSGKELLHVWQVLWFIDSTVDSTKNITFCMTLLIRQGTSIQMFFLDYSCIKIHDLFWTLAVHVDIHTFTLALALIALLLHPTNKIITGRFLELLDYWWLVIISGYVKSVVTLYQIKAFITLWEIQLTHPFFRPISPFIYCTYANWSNFVLIYFGLHMFKTCTQILLLLLCGLQTNSLLSYLQLLPIGVFWTNSLSNTCSHHPSLRISIQQVRVLGNSGGRSILSPRAVA